MSTPGKTYTHINKGGLYTLLYVATMAGSESGMRGEDMAVYKDSITGKRYVRTLKSFEDSMTLHTYLRADGKIQRG